MDDWQRMFGFVQATAQTARNVDEGIDQAVALAKRHRQDYAPEYWERVKPHDFGDAASTVVAWAREGFANLTPADSWDFLILDLGDCPEIFCLYRLNCQDMLDEDRFYASLRADTIVDLSGLPECLPPNATSEELVYHNVRELKDEILSWDAADDMDDEAGSDYLLWLVIG